MGDVPDFIPPDRAWFEVLPSGLPLLVINLERDALRALPLPRTDHAAPEAAATLAGWQLMARSTMRVVDGPEDLGFLVGVEPTDLDVSTAWVESTAKHGGAIVYFMRVPDAATEVDARVRGGFIRNRE
jgi:hypothetical protein